MYTKLRYKINYLYNLIHISILSVCLFHLCGTHEFAKKKINTFFTCFNNNQFKVIFQKLNSKLIYIFTISHIHISKLIYKFEYYLHYLELINDIDYFERVLIEHFKVFNKNNKYQSIIYSLIRRQKYNFLYLHTVLLLICDFSLEILLEKKFD